MWHSGFDAGPLSRQPVSPLLALVQQGGARRLSELLAGCQMSVVRVTFNDGHTAERCFVSFGAALDAARVYAHIVRIDYVLVWEVQNG